MANNLIERYMLGNVDVGYWGIDIDNEAKTATYTRNGHPITGPIDCIPLEYRNKLCRMVVQGSDYVPL